jgi:hypothetical protein
LPRPALALSWWRTDGSSVGFINVHLKSKLLELPGGRFNPRSEAERATVAHFALERRAPEAASLRQSAAELLEAARSVIVLGDFNDGPQAATTEIVYGPIGSQPERPEDALQGSSAFNRADQEEGLRLFNVT